MSRYLSPDVVRAYRKAAKLTRTELALRAGLGRNTLLGMDDPDWSPVWRTLKKLEAVIPPDFNGKGEDETLQFP